MQSIVNNKIYQNKWYDNALYNIKIKAELKDIVCDKSRGTQPLESSI